MKRDSFLANNDFGFTRAKNVMNSKSSYDFRWSAYVSSGIPISIGLASKTPRRSIHGDLWIWDVDPHAILFEPYAEGLGFEITIFWAHDCRAIVCDIRQRLGNKICTKIVPEKGLEFQNDFEPCVAHTKEYEDIMDTGSVYEIHFRFQPNLKKLLVSMVRSQWNSLTALKFLACFNLEFQKGEEYSYDIQENIDYFPFVQGHKSSKVTLFKPRED